MPQQVRQARHIHHTRKPGSHHNANHFLNALHQGTPVVFNPRGRSRQFTAISKGQDRVPRAAVDDRHAGKTRPSHQAAAPRTERNLKTLSRPRIRRWLSSPDLRPFRQARLAPRTEHAVQFDDPDGATVEVQP